MTPSAPATASCGCCTTLPVSNDVRGVRAGAHEDINVITPYSWALRKPGCNFAMDRAGNWIDVDPPEGCAVVNIGDMLQRLTNHLLPSTTHRVVIPGGGCAARPRYSFPFFQHFRPDYLIETLPCCVSEAGPNPIFVPRSHHRRRRLPASAAGGDQTDLDYAVLSTPTTAPDRQVASVPGDQTCAARGRT